MSLCILTNNSALFSSITSASSHLIHTVELNVDGECVLIPSVDDFSRAYSELEHSFGSILVLVASENILPGADLARIAAQIHGGSAKISVMDSQQIGPGLAMLVHIAAQQAAHGLPLPAVEDHLRAIIPHLFTLLCPDHLPYYQIGRTTQKTGPVRDQTDAQQVYSIEEGHLVPYKKVRTQRHLIETMQEFLEEFENPQEIACFRGNDNSLRTRSLLETSGNLFPGIAFNECELNPLLKTLLGAQSLGLTVLE